ncbi:unnamed protein product [Caenorhabditis angaria]|uniref:C2H2-type domain-containing protein n=1 Tax=Caenorhabditis angaria TaxID=860376 RepID=A0A9P1IXU8_9PELO|nr:unnamed protein product [Caenorhabditis angaria]
MGGVREDSKTMLIWNSLRSPSKMMRFSPFPFVSMPHLIYNSWLISNLQNQQLQLHQKVNVSKSEEEIISVTKLSPPLQTKKLSSSTKTIKKEKQKIEETSAQKMKRRVKCESCSKSFCDKGALKIHTSAVHLREMHMCTVNGCGKQFSSRRSRNRHSSNTNPKLHMPESLPTSPKSPFWSPANFLIISPKNEMNK